MRTGLFRGRRRGPAPASTRRRAWLLGCCLVLLAAGCGDDRKPLYPVQGRVLFEDRPPPQALVVFHPLGDQGKEAVRPRGQVGPDGSFTLTTHNPGDGAPAGAYAVTVEWW